MHGFIPEVFVLRNIFGVRFLDWESITERCRLPGPESFLEISAPVIFLVLVPIDALVLVSVVVLRRGEGVLYLELQAVALPAAAALVLLEVWGSIQ